MLTRRCSHCTGQQADLPRSLSYSILPPSGAVAVQFSQGFHNDMMDKHLTVITGVVRRAPEWVRHDLLAKDPAGRQRAEEALAAMIAAALRDDPVYGKRVG